jgi:hypothetical protein
MPVADAIIVRAASWWCRHASQRCPSSTVQSGPLKPRVNETHSELYKQTMKVERTLGDQHPRRLAWLFRLAGRTIWGTW